MKRLDDLKRFYNILGVLNERLGGARLLCECSGKLSWPRRGVYLFMEDGRRAVKVEWGHVLCVLARTR